jgi:hypothetical protein
MRVHRCTHINELRVGRSSIDTDRAEAMLDGSEHQITNVLAG